MIRLILLGTFLSNSWLNAQEKKFKLTDSAFEGGSIYTTWDLKFKFDKAQLEDESFFILDSIAAILHNNPTIVMKISRYGDKVPDNYCIKMGYRRSQAIVDYLVKTKCIDPRRLISHSYGTLTPIIPESEIKKEKDKGKQMEMEQMNKRTEFKIIGDDFCGE